jgi:hypothetical protein
VTEPHWNVLKSGAVKLAGGAASIGLLDGRYECTMPEPRRKCAALSCEDAEYIEDLWFTLHHSENAGDVMLGLSWYLDDSGSDDGSPLVTCGGIAMDRINFRHFSERWAKMYEKYRNQFSGVVFEQPLHMTEFVGDGKYAGLRPEFKRALFLEVAEIINAHKLYSMSIAVPQDDFADQLSENVRKVLIGPYALAFMSIILGHQFLSERHPQGPLKASYLVDCGFGHYDQLVEVHRVILGIEIEVARLFGGFRHAGALAQDSDDRVQALQAADAVAWASRRRRLKGELPEGLEPLLEVIREEGRGPLHATVPVEFDDIKMLAKPINNWIAKFGKLPALSDILMRRVGSFGVKLRS